MLVQCSDSTVLSVAEVALEARAIPSRTCCDILCVRVGVCEQFVCQQATRITLTDCLENCAVVDVLGSWA